MKRTLIHKAAIGVVASLLVTFGAQSASAGQIIQLLFSGQDAAGKQFEGCVQYDQSKPRDMPSIFKFTGTGGTFQHESCFVTATSLLGSGSGGFCDPFTIDTSVDNRTTLKVSAKLGALTMSVFFKTNVTFSPVGQLPFCNTGGGSPVFKNAGTFQLVNSGGTTVFSGSITSVNCSQPAGANVHCPPCSLGAATAPAPAPPPAAPLVVYLDASPQPCAPVYECAPRRGCCLSRLFSWGSCRNRCR